LYFGPNKIGFRLCILG